MRKNFGAKPFLYPQPVMILGTYDENGKANAMNAAWGGIVGANEIIVDLSAHKTTDNIIKNKAFTVGVADLEHLVACDYVGIVSANKEADKMKKAGFTTTKGEFVNRSLFQSILLLLSVLKQFHMHDSFPYIQIRFLILLSLFLKFLSPSLSSFSIFQTLL